MLVWLQVHGLSQTVLENEEIVLSLAGDVETPIANTLYVLLEFVRVKISLNPNKSLIVGSYIHRTSMKPLPVMFKYKRVGLICSKSISLWHMADQCKHLKISGNQKMPLIFLLEHLSIEVHW